MKQHLHREALSTLQTHTQGMELEGYFVTWWSQVKWEKLEKLNIHKHTKPTTYTNNIYMVMLLKLINIYI